MGESVSDDSLDRYTPWRAGETRYMFKSIEKTRHILWNGAAPARDTNRTPFCPAQLSTVTGRCRLKDIVCMSSCFIWQRWFRETQISHPWNLDGTHTSLYLLNPKMTKNMLKDTFSSNQVPIFPKIPRKITVVGPSNWQFCTSNRHIFYMHALLCGHFDWIKTGQNTIPSIKPKMFLMIMIVPKLVIQNAKKSAI